MEPDRCKQHPYRCVGTILDPSGWEAGEKRDKENSRDRIAGSISPFNDDKHLDYDLDYGFDHGLDYDVPIDKP